MVSYRHVPQIQNSSEDYFNVVIEIPIREVSIIDVSIQSSIESYFNRYSTRVRCEYPFYFQLCLQPVGMTTESNLLRVKM